jgi:N-acetylglucosamine-6-phosphate deacetylase
MRLRSKRIVTPAGTIAGEISIRDGHIESVGAASAYGDATELGRRWIVPGLLDMHVHGGGGAQCNTADPDEIARVAAFHARHGTTGMLATTVAASPDELAVALGAIHRAMEGSVGAGVLGAHLEGPFLSPRRPGAMDPSTFLKPEGRIAEQLLAAGGGSVRLMTLAPELPGALELVRSLVDAGVVASIGHSDATYDQARAAVWSGAHAATHAFNAMRPLHHREPGVLGAVLDLPQVSCELICDGIHAEPAALRLAYRAKGPAGVRLVTDAMQAAGMPDGEYRLGAARVRVADGRATLADDGSIAGSTLTMDRAVRNAVGFLGITVEEAVVLASVNPARLLGIADRKGAIAPGMDADLTILDDDLRACATVIAGAWTHGPPANGDPGSS